MRIICRIHCFLLMNKQSPDTKAGLHKTVSASKAIFFSNTAKNRYGRRQPYHSDFSCLSVKSSLLKCFAVFLYGFFATKNIPLKYWMYFKGIFRSYRGKDNCKTEYRFMEPRLNASGVLCPFFDIVCRGAFHMPPQHDVNILYRADMESAPANTLFPLSCRPEFAPVRSLRPE